MTPRERATRRRMGMLAIISTVRTSHKKRRRADITSKEAGEGIFTVFPAGSPQIAAVVTLHNQGFATSADSSDPAIQSLFTAGGLRFESGCPDQWNPQLPAAVRSLDAAQPIHNLHTVSDIRDTSLAPERLNLSVLGVFALVALSLSVVGLYGVLA